METPKISKFSFRPLIVLAFFSLLICGMIFPLFVTGLAKVLFPYQANGEIIQFNGHPVGSDLIAQTFTLPQFFHPRNDSASGVDPHITLQDAYSQIPRINQWTDISEDELFQIVNENREGIYWILGSPYVNVLRLNIVLIKTYPQSYSEYQ